MEAEMGADLSSSTDFRVNSLRLRGCGRDRTPPRVSSKENGDDYSLTSPKAFVELGMVALSHRCRLVGFLVEVKALE